MYVVDHRFFLAFCNYYPTENSVESISMINPAIKKIWNVHSLNWVIIYRYALL